MYILNNRRPACQCRCHIVNVYTGIPLSILDNDWFYMKLEECLQGLLIYLPLTSVPFHCYTWCLLTITCCIIVWLHLTARRQWYLVAPRRAIQWAQRQLPSKLFPRVLELESPSPYFRRLWLFILIGKPLYMQHKWLLPPSSAASISPIATTTQSSTPQTWSIVLIPNHKRPCGALYCWAMDWDTLDRHLGQWQWRHHNLRKHH